MTPGLNVEGSVRQCLQATHLSKWWRYAVERAVLLAGSRTQERKGPLDWPVFGALVVEANRQRSQVDFAYRGYVGWFMVLDKHIPTGQGRFTAIVELFFWKG